MKNLGARLILPIMLSQLSCDVFGTFLVYRPRTLAFLEEFAEVSRREYSGASIYFSFADPSACNSGLPRHFSIALYVHPAISSYSRDLSEGEIENFGINRAYHFAPSLPYFRHNYRASLLEGDPLYPVLLTPNQWYRLPVPPRRLAITAVLARPSPDSGRPKRDLEFQRSFFIDLRDGGERWLRFADDGAFFGRVDSGQPFCASTAARRSSPLLAAPRRSAPRIAQRLEDDPSQLRNCGSGPPYESEVAPRLEPRPFGLSNPRASHA